MFENIFISLVLIACVYYLIHRLWPGSNHASSQSGGCNSCATTCHSTSIEKNS